MKSILIISTLTLTAFGKPAPVDPIGNIPEALDGKPLSGYGTATSTVTSSTLTLYGTTTTFAPTPTSYGHHHHHHHHWPHKPHKSHRPWYNPFGLFLSEEPVDIPEAPEQADQDEEVIQWELKDVDEADEQDQLEASSPLIDLKRLFVIKKLTNYNGAVFQCTKRTATVPFLKRKSELLALAKFLYKKGVLTAFVNYRGRPFIIRVIIKIVAKKTKTGTVKVKVVSFKIFKAIGKAFIVCEKRKIKTESAEELESVAQLNQEDPEDLEDVEGDDYGYKKHHQKHYDHYKKYQEPYKKPYPSYDDHHHDYKPTPGSWEDYHFGDDH